MKSTTTFSLDSIFSNTPFFPNLKLKTLILLSSILMMCSFVGWGQVSVTATAGTVGPTSYATLNGTTGAFAAINAGTHQGVITITITSSYTEVAATGLNKSGSGSSSYTSISIKPAGNVTVTGPAATNNGAVIYLLGADNVTIDGDDPLTAGTNNLSIVSPTGAKTQAVIRLSSNSTTGTDGADNNTIKNCNIIGARASATASDVTYGIVMAQAGTNSAGAYSSINTIIQNNVITRCWHGIYANGASATYPNTGTQILNNTLGSSVSADNIGFRGIYLTYSAVSSGGAIIRGNDIRVGDYGTTGYTSTIAGIEVGTVNYGFTIDRNNIHDINQPATGGYGAHGIYITGSANNTVSTITNNMIRDIKMVVYQISATSTFIPSGVFFTASATNVAFVGNTVFMGAQLGAGVNYTSFCVDASVSGVTFSRFQNNILVNNHSSNAAYCFWTAATANISGGTVNNNCYFAPNGSANVGYYNAANTTTLSAWQTATSKDNNAISVNPPFISATDLHLNTSGTGIASFFGTGAAGTGVTTDYDGDTRAAIPCIGADEFTLQAQCATYTSPTNIATGQSQTGVTLTWSAATYATGYDVYFDQNASPTTLVAANQAGLTYSTGTLLPSTTYYWKVVPKNSGTTASGCNIWSFTTQAAVPTLSTTPTTISFGAGCLNTATNASTFNMNALNLTGSSVTITAPTDFLVSEDNATYSSTITVNHNAGSFTNKTIYVKFNPTSATSYSGNIAITDGGLSSTVNVAVSGTGTAYTTPTLAVTSNDNDNIFCSGTSVTFTATGSNLVGGTVSNYQWKLNGNNVGTSSTTYSNTGLINNDVVSCVITITGGTCLSSQNATSNSISNTVNALPTIAISSTTNTYCSTAVPLTASGASTYTWSPTSTLSATNGTTVNASPTATTTYTASGTDANGCIGTATKVITKGNPVTAGSVTAAQPSACAGGTVQLNGSASITALPNSYSFTATSGTFTPLTGATTISGGNADSYFSGALPIGFNFNYNGSTYSNFFFSSNGFISFTNSIGTGTANALATASSPVLAPLWDDNDGASVGAASYLTSGSVGNRILTVQWLNWEWYYTANAAVISFQVKLYEIDGRIEFIYRQEAAAPVSPSASIGITGVSGNYLSLNGTGTSPSVSSTTETSNLSTKPATGQTYTFTPPSLTYAWTYTDNANALSSTTITNPVATVNATDTYTFTATGSDGCSASGTAQITLGGGAPNVTANASSSALCVGATTTLSTTITGGCSPFTYSWSDGTSVVSTAASFSASPTSTTTYTLTVTDNNSSIASGSVTVTVNNLPTITVNSGTFCSGGTPLALTASGASTYAWSPSTGLSGTTGSSVNANPTSTTTYTVTGTDANGCISTGTSTVTYALTPSAISLSQTPASACSGSVATLVATGGSISPSGYIAPASPTAQGGAISATAYAIGTYYQIFNVLQPFTLVSVDVFPTAAVGTVASVSIADNTGNILTTANYTVTNSNGTTPHTVMLNYPLTVGTGYRIGQGGTAINLNRNTTNQTYPVSNSYLSITGNNFSSGASYWYYIYNWQYTVPATATFAWSPTTNLYTNSAATTAYTGGSATTVYALNTSTTQYTVTAANGVCTSTNNINTSISDLPTITLGSAAPVCAGGTSSSLSYTATTGSPNQYIIDYDATANAAGFVDVTTYTAFSSSPISLAIPSGASAGTYNGTITVKNSTTGCISQSYSFTVTVNQPASISAQPSNQVILPNDNVSFAVSATGTGLTYQWEESTDNGSTWAALSNGGIYSGVSSNTLTLTNVSTGSGNKYRCVVSGTAPCSAATSNVATLTLSTTAITTHPQNQAVCESSGSATFTISTTGSTPNYQWEYSTDGGTSWSALAGETNATLLLSGLTTSQNAYQYHCVLNSTITSNAATLTVSAPSVAGSVSADQGICSNASAANITLTGNTGTIQWQVSSDNISFTNISSATASPLTSAQIGSLSATRYYRAVVTNGACAAANSGVVTVTVTTNPNAGTLSGTQSVCANATTTFSSNGDAGGAWTTAAGNIATVNSSGVVSALAAGTTTITYTITGTGGCNNATATRTVTVNALPTTLSISPTSASICNGAIQTLTASGGLVTVYQNDFESGVTGFTPSASATATSNTTYYAAGSKSVLFNTSATSNQYLTYDNVFNLANASSVQLSFKHIAAMEGASTSYDYGLVEYSADGGTTWTSFVPADYVGSASTTPFNTNVRFTTKSYPDWISTLTSSTALPNNSLWKTESFNIPSAALTSQFKIRFRYNPDASTFYYGWLIDDILLTKASSITWSPTTALYTNSAATTAYTGTSAATVYAQPSTTTTYTATATNSFGCSSSAGLTITVNQPTITWTGATSSDPTVASNWTPAGLPCTVAAITIPVVNTNYPSYTNLTISSGGSLTLQSGAQLTVTGVLTNNGTMTIESGATFKQGTSVAGTGTYNVQQALDNCAGSGSTLTGRYWYLGSPVSCTRSSSFGSASALNKVWSFTNGAYGSVADATTLSPTSGYVHRRSDNATLTFTGTNLYAQDATLSLSNNAGTYAGWHLVSNPYTAYLDWVQMYNASSNISASYYIRSYNTTGNDVDALITYSASTGLQANTSSYNLGSVGATTAQYIAPMQAIWVKVLGSTSTVGSLSLNRNYTSHQTGGLKSSTIFPTLARVNLVNGARFDQMLVYMNPDMTNGVDQYDSEKMFVSGASQIYTMAAGKKLVMNGLKNNKSKISVPVYLELPESKVYQLSLAEYILEDGIILLEDKQEGTIQDFTIHDVYSFYATSGVLSNRFVLHFFMPDNGITAQGPSNNWVEDEAVINEGGNILVNSDGRGKVTIHQDIDPSPSAKGNVVVRDAAGREVWKGQLNGSATTLELDTPSGIYFVEVELNGQVEMKKIFVQQ